MARFTNKATGVIVNVDDSKAHRFPADTWDSDAPAADGYSALKVAELRDEIGRRNEGRAEDALLSTEGNKAALVAILEADDEA